MGIRMDQHMGLNFWAQKFVEGEEVLLCKEKVTRTYLDGRQESSERDVHGSSVKKEESGETFMGMFDDEYPLHRYIFPDGRMYHEKVQVAPWSSGSVFFLALQDEGGNWVRESLWSQEETDHV